MPGNDGASEPLRGESRASKTKRKCCQQCILCWMLILGIIIASVVYGIFTLSRPATVATTQNGAMAQMMNNLFRPDEINSNPGRDGKLQISVGMRNDYKLQDCRFGGLKKSFPDIDYALMGYNVLKGYPLAAGHDPGFTQPIFKADYSGGKQSADCKFSVPNGYTVVPDVSCSVSFTSETIKNSEDLKKSMSVSAHVSGGGWGVSFSAASSYQKDSRTVSKGEQVFIISTAVCQTYFSRMDDVSLPPLNPSFIKWVEKLNNTDDVDTYLDFIAYYGTHYMKSVTFGARYVHQHTMTSKSYQELNSDSMSVEAKASYSGLFNVGGGFGFSQSQSSAVENFNSKVETKTLTIGSAPPKNGDAMTWASEAKETPVPYKYEMESIESIFSPSLKVQYPKLDTKRIRLNLEYVRLRHAKDIYQRSLANLCRVYNAAIPLPGTCLSGHNDTAMLDEKHCIQECLDRSGCVAITMRSQNKCYFFSRTYIHGSANHLCRSMLFPFRLESYVDAFSPVEIPGKMTISGAHVDEEDPREELVNWQIFSRFLSGKDIKVDNQLSCEKRCLGDPECVLAAYTHYQTSGEIICKLFAESEISRINFIFKGTKYNWRSGTRRYYLTFIKTCNLGEYESN